MNEPSPAIGGHFEEEQEVSRSASQRKSDSLFDVSLGSHVEPVIERKSGHLSPERTKRYGMTDFSDLTVKDNLLQEFDPLSSQNGTDEEPPDQNTNKPSFARSDSRDGMELHRASGLISGRIKETSLENAASSSIEATSSGFDTEPVDDKYNFNINDGELFEDKHDLDTAVAQKGKVSHAPYNANNKAIS